MSSSDRPSHSPSSSSASSSSAVPLRLHRHLLMQQSTAAGDVYDLSTLRAALKGHQGGRGGGLQMPDKAEESPRGQFLPRIPSTTGYSSSDSSPHSSPQSSPSSPITFPPSSVLSTPTLLSLHSTPTSSLSFSSSSSSPYRLDGGLPSSHHRSGRYLSDSPFSSSTSTASPSTSSSVPSPHSSLLSSSSSSSSSIASSRRPLCLRRKRSTDGMWGVEGGGEGEDGDFHDEGEGGEDEGGRRASPPFFSTLRSLSPSLPPSPVSSFPSHPPTSSFRRSSALPPRPPRVHLRSLRRPPVPVSVTTRSPRIGGSPHLLLSTPEDLEEEKVGSDDSWDFQRKRRRRWPFSPSPSPPVHSSEEEEKDVGGEEGGGRCPVLRSSPLDRLRRLDPFISPQMPSQTATKEGMDGKAEGGEDSGTEEQEVVLPAVVPPHHVQHALTRLHSYSLQ